MSPIRHWHRSRADEERQRPVHQWAGATAVVAGLLNRGLPKGRHALVLMLLVIALVTGASSVTSAAPVRPAGTADGQTQAAPPVFPSLPSGNLPSAPSTLPASPGATGTSSAPDEQAPGSSDAAAAAALAQSLINIYEPTRPLYNSYSVFC
jgi:hypothetical protein